MAEVNWSEMFALRHAPMEERYVTVPAKRLAAQLSTGRRRLLDFGSGPGALRQELDHAGFGGDYESFDIDPMVPATYRRLERIPPGFDVICGLEVIEHCSLEQTLEYFAVFFRLLTDRGLLIISTPDPSHPTWIREDITHRQHYPPRDTAALLQLLGFKHPTLYHIVNRQARRFRGPGGWALGYLGWLHTSYLTRMTGVNFTSRGYLLTIEKSSKDQLT